MAIPSSKEDFCVPLSFENSKPQNFRDTLIRFSEWYLSFSDNQAILMQPGDNKVIIQKNLEEKKPLLTAIKIASWFLGIFALPAFIIKLSYRLCHQFEIYNPEKALNGDLKISTSTLQKLIKLMPSLLLGENSNDINWISTRNTLVFKHSDRPDLIFKIQRKIENNHNVDGIQRYQNAIRIKKIIDIQKLNLLVVPSTLCLSLKQICDLTHIPSADRKEEYNNVYLMVEKSLPINPNFEGQLQEFYTYQNSTLPAIEQYIKLVSLTGLADSSPENNPLIIDQQDSIKLAILDSEVLDQEGNAICTPYIIAEEGRYHPRNGLLSYLPMDQLDSVLDLCKKYKIKLPEKKIEIIRSARIKELIRNAA